MLDNEQAASDTPPMRPWQDAPPVDTRALAELGLHPIVARALLRRGLTDPASARGFLDPHVSSPSLPAELPGMEVAVARISTALDRREAIWIWGDFDVDGQTATSVLVQGLSRLGGSPKFHVPLRAREGHGIQLEALGAVIDRGAQLIVTCDTGITAHDAVQYARRRGVDIVITDHHELGHTLPDAVAVVNPRLLPDEHALANLAGVGVAFELARALLESRGHEFDGFLDLVALGLIADVALLRGDARLLAQRGIQALRSTRREGLLAMARLAKINLPALNEETIGFELAPRLNAVGRLGDANQAVELLLTDDRGRAEELAGQVEELNIRRRLLTEQVAGAAEEQLRSDPTLLSRSMLVLSNPSWPGGVLGIVASRLVERYQKPALLLSAGPDGNWHGSARSIDGLDITAAIAANEKHLRGYGGHPMAAGLSLDLDLLPRFQHDLERTVDQMLLEAEVPESILAIDEWLGLGQLSLDLADQLQALSPFGAGNPQLVFATHDLRLVSSNEFGKSRNHRRLVLADEHGVEREMLWWNSALEPVPPERIDAAYSIRANSFGGERKLNVEVRDLRAATEAVIAITSAGPELVDLRADPLAENRIPPGCLVWAEAADRTRGQDREHLRRASDFAIWTAPPSRDDLRAAMATVRPRKVYLVGKAPPDLGLKAFLEQVAGMANYAINHREGKLRLAEVAAAAAHRELTVHLGLEWLAAAGQLATHENEGELQLARAKSSPDRELQAELQAGIQSLLEETAAYRHHFARAAADTLLDFA